MANHVGMTVLSLVRDPEFASLWQSSCEEFIPHARFMARRAPEGLAIEEAYAIVEALKHRIATVLPFDNYVPGIEGPDNWFFVTGAMHDMLTEIVTRASIGSRLDLCLKEHVTEQTKLLLLTDEFVSLARRDGIHADPERVVAIWSHALKPVTPVDHLCERFGLLASHAPGMADRDLTAGLFEFMNAQLLEGVDLEDCLHPQPRIKSRKPSSLDNPETALHMASEIVRGLGVSADIHPVFRAMLISGIFWEFFPLPQASALTEYVVRSALLDKAGLPVLRWVRFSAISERWERGMLVDPAIPFPYLGETVDCGEGYDSTNHFTAELTLVRHELDRLQEKLDALDEKGRAAREIVREKLSVNGRQLDVLLLALKNPGHRVSISEHRRNYGVAYATAHDDLVGLERLGLMSQIKVGRAFFFEATPRLEALARGET